MRFVFKLPFRVEVFMKIRLRYLGLGHWKTILLNSSLGRVPQTLPNQYLGNASERPWSRPIVTASRPMNQEAAPLPVRSASSARALQIAIANMECPKWEVPSMNDKATYNQISHNILGDLDNLCCPGKWLHRTFGIAVVHGSLYDKS